ncbi:peroxisome biogenesis protein 5-like isoform X3 [Gossypium arboreum]|uniref:peroxisome biogenesis protein 5-like isoform X3 n=1 Tax=Gossypium arboreum TaxID=29729 RepID=UPI0008192CBA|nr:peroxisome biogenesis protein 5-like isoform X3 [Gossypium arboreum]
MMRAQEADPINLEVLLALGVSHTNELEQTVALKYLYGWLRHHSKYGTLAPPELANSLYYAYALNLKPNYVRAWANMGISYANQVSSGWSLSEILSHCQAIAIGRNYMVYHRLEKWSSL